MTTTASKRKFETTSERGSTDILSEKVPNMPPTSYPGAMYLKRATQPGPLDHESPLSKKYNQLADISSTVASKSKCEDKDVSSTVENKKAKKASSSLPTTSAVVVRGKDRVSNRASDFYNAGDDNSLPPPSLMPNRDVTIDKQKRVAAPPDESKWSALLVMSEPDALEQALRDGSLARAKAVARYAEWRATLGAALEKPAEYDLKQYDAIAEDGEPDDESFFHGDHLDTPLQMPMDLFFALASWDTIHSAFGANAVRVWHMGVHVYYTTNVGVLATVLDEESDPDHATSIIERCAFNSLFNDGGTRYVDEHLFSLALFAPLEQSMAEDGALERALAYTMLLPGDNYRWFRTLVERTAQMIEPHKQSEVLVRAACKSAEGAALLAQVARRNGWKRAQLESLVNDVMRSAEPTVALAHASLFGSQVRARDKKRIMREFDAAQ